MSVIFRQMQDVDEKSIQQADIESSFIAHPSH